MQLLTTRKAAEKLGYSSRHVCRLVHENRLQPFAVLDNGHNVFTVEVVDAYKVKKSEGKEVKIG